MGDTPLPFPRRGINDNWAKSTQPSESTPDAANMRSVDASTGRVRGAKRSGMSKHYASAADANPIRVAVSIVYDSKTVVYEALEGELDTFGAGLSKMLEVWSEKSKPNLDVVNVQTDLSSNVYAVSGQTVEKRNADGLLLWAFKVPLSVDAHNLGPLAVGLDLGVYVAVSDGSGGSDGAGVFRIGQSPIANSNDTEPFLEWSYITNKWVPELRIVGPSLYVLENDDPAKESWVEGLNNLSAGVPVSVGAISVPYPSTCMVVKDDGSVVTGHPFRADREKNGTHPGVDISLQAWTPEDLPGFGDRVWSWYRSEDLLGLGLADGDAVDLWPDQSGNGRHLYPGTPWHPLDGQGGGINPPTLNTNASFVQPSVEFDGTQGLFSKAGGGKDSQRDGNLAMLPNHGDGAFVTLVMCRPKSQFTDNETDAAGVPIRWRRYLLEMRHHTKWKGNDPGSWDRDNTGAYISGLVLNAGTQVLGISSKYTWGKDFSLSGIEAPGHVRAYTSSSGNLTGTVWPGMPTNQGAGLFRGAWTKSGLWDDPSTTEVGEGMVLFTFMHGGGLDEALDVQGVVDAAGFIFTPDDPKALTQLQGLYGGSRYGGLAYLDGVATGTVATVTGTTLTFSAPQAAGAARLSVVPSNRNMMSRSAMRVNGVTVDRWESLPMAYTGANTGPVEYNLDKNVAEHPVGFGLPAGHDYIKGFLGEVVEVLTLGRRETNKEMVTLAGVEYHRYPAVATMPMEALYQDGAESDADWYSPGTNLNSSEVEKIEGYFMHKYGTAKRLHTSSSSTTVDSSMDAAVSSVGAEVSLGSENWVTMTVAAVSGAHNNHDITLQELLDDNGLWHDTSITVNKLGSASGGIASEKFRAAVTTLEGAASVVDVTVVKSSKPHPHYPAISTTTFDIPLADANAQTGQAWIVRKRSDEAMILKHDPNGKMIWCLLAAGIWGTGEGDLVSEDLNGISGTGFSGLTTARATGGLALGLDGEIFFAGPGSGANSEEFCLGVIYDLSDDEADLPLRSVGWFTLGAPLVPDTFKLGFEVGKTIRIVSDAFGNLYVPVPKGTTYLGSPTTPDALRAFSRAGGYLFRLTTLGGGGIDPFQNGNAVALPPTNPDYHV